MKNIFLLLTVILSYACDKEKVNIPDERPKAVTEWVSHCDSSWKVIETHIAIHWCAVSGEDLKRFEAIENKRDSSQCPDNAITWVVITESDCNGK